MGLPFTGALRYATSAVELLGGMAVLLGALLPLAAMPMIVVLLVAIVTVHLPNGFSSNKLLSFDAGKDFSDNSRLRERPDRGANAVCHDR